MFKKSLEQIKEMFFELNTRQDVAELLEINDRSLCFFLYVKRPENMYSTFKLLKHDNTYREINAPQKDLKNIQRKLAYILNLVYKIKPSAYGFISGKNILANANNHLRRKVVLNIDLKDFFGQIHFGRVRGMLIKKPYNIGEEAATVIAQLACYNGILPQGAPSSPVITNMICSPLDTQLIKIAKKHNIRYTRYADDITFSTFDKNFSEKIVNNDPKNVLLGSEIIKTLDNNGFKINNNKIFLNNRDTRQEVTGLVVNKFPNIKREKLKNLRAILFNCKKYGILQTAKKYVGLGYCHNNYIIDNINNEECEDVINSWFKAVLKGKIGFIKHIRGGQDFLFLKYAEKINCIFNEPIFDISVLKYFNDKIINNVLVLESDNFQGTCFLLKNYGLVTNYHVTEDGDFYNAYSYKEYKINKICTISKNLNEIRSDKTIDYAIYDFTKNNEDFLELSHNKLEVGDEVTIIGYPNYQQGNSPNIQKCSITSTKYYMGSTFYTVSGSVFHGASGGAVLDKQNKVVGIIKGGVVNSEDQKANENQGFVPLDIVLEHFNKTE